MAKIITAVLVTQTACGIFLKLHILEKTVRPWVVRVHGILGKFFPVIGWTRECSVLGRVKWEREH